MRNRWYEPQTGRFLSEDPAGVRGGLNAYVYAGADPIDARDPSGLKECYDFVTYWNYADGSQEEISRTRLYCTPDGSDGGGGLGSGSGGGGSLGRDDAAHVLGPEGPACGGKLWGFTKNLVPDLLGISFVRGLKAIRAGRFLRDTYGVRMAGRAATQFSLGHITEATRLERNALRAAIASDARLASGYGQVGVEAYNTEETVLGDDSPLLKGAQLLPFGFGSGISLGIALDACFPRFFGAN